MDKKEVYMLSTMYTAEFKTVIRHGGERVIQKPVCVLDYNNSMGAVDKADMGAVDKADMGAVDKADIISTVNSTRKSLK